jgi:hypothetical protein
MFLAQKGMSVYLITKTAKFYEGIIASTTEREAETTGVTLREVKDLSAPGAPVKSQLFITSTNIDFWSPVPANNTSAPPHSNTTWRAVSRERLKRQTLSDLTVCDILDAHKVSTHLLV